MEFKVNGEVIKIKVIPIHDLIPYENNVKIHPVKQLEGLANSYQDFGLKSAIVIDKNNVIIAGHARYEAAAAIGWDQMLCIVADDLSDQKINAYRILDNKIAEQGGTDIRALEIELAKLPDIDFKKYNTDITPLKVSIPEMQEKETKELKFITCPRCEHEFTQEDL